MFICLMFVVCLPSQRLNKGGTCRILDARQIDCHKTASIQKNDNISWAHLFLCVSVRLWPLLPVSACFCLFLSFFFPFCPFLSISVHFCLFLSVSFHFSLYLFIIGNGCKLMKWLEIDGTGWKCLPNGSGKPGVLV